MVRSRKYEQLRQALLIGGPHKDDVGMHNDLAAMYDALRARGLASKEILSLEGGLDRQILMIFLEGVGRRMVHWSEGEFFLYLSGHGFFNGNTVEEARVGIQLREATPGSSIQNVYWEEVFSALSIPEAVTFTMLVDHWHTNLLAGRVPANVTGIVTKTIPGGELTCQTHEMDVDMNGLLVRRGIISYYASLTMEKATDMQSWIELMEQRSNKDLTQHRISIFHKPMLQICGNASVKVIGE